MCVAISMAIFENQVNDIITRRLTSMIIVRGVFKTTIGIGDDNQFSFITDGAIKCLLARFMRRAQFRRIKFILPIVLKVKVRRNNNGGGVKTFESIGKESFARSRGSAENKNSHERRIRPEMKSPKKIIINRQSN